jgi:MFS family permease
MPAPEGPGQSLFKMLSAPFADKNYRQIMIFTFLRAFTIQLAVPFFTVYMLVRLELPLTMVVGLGVISQVSNVLFLRVWGPMVDQFGSKVILSLCTSLYMLVILGWTFTTMPEEYFLTLPLLVVLHVLAGIATAGLNISSMTIRLKASPPAQATAYLTGGSLALNLGAGISPLIGGFFADFFSVRQFRVSFEWIDPDRIFEFPALFLTGYDFLFAVAFILGFFALNALALIREEGEVDRETVLNELRAQTRDNFRVLTSVPGMSAVSHFPYSTIQRYMPHVTGLDVAVEVTALQLASSTRDAVNAAVRGGTTTANVARRVNGTITSAVRRAGRLGDRYGLELAREATRGAVHAVSGVTDDVQTVTRGAVRGTLNALGKTVGNTGEVLWGAGYGVVQGAVEAGTDLASTVRHAVQEARESAKGLGISEAEAAAEVARGAVQAAEAHGPDTAAKVKEAVLDELLENVLPESEVERKGNQPQRPGSQE